MTLISSKAGEIMAHGTVFLEIGETIQINGYIDVHIFPNSGLVDHDPYFGAAGVETTNKAGFLPSVTWGPSETESMAKCTIETLPRPGQYLIWREKLTNSDSAEMSLWTIDLRVRWLIDLKLAELTYVIACATGERE